MTLLQFFISACIVPTILGLYTMSFLSLYPLWMRWDYLIQYERNTNLIKMVSLAKNIFPVKCTDFRYHFNLIFMRRLQTCWSKIIFYPLLHNDFFLWSQLGKVTIFRKVPSTIIYRFTIYFICENV